MVRYQEKTGKGEEPVDSDANRLERISGKGIEVVLPFDETHNHIYAKHAPLGRNSERTAHLRDAK